MEMEVQHQVMGYDRASTMFSPDGRLLQVEYAEKTVRLGSASIGLTCVDGVVIVSDKRIVDPLISTQTATKIWEIDSNIIASAAGIVSDARILMERAQVIAQQHRITYDESIDVESVIKEIANMKQAFTQYGGARPFGVEVMVTGINADSGDAQLYVSDVTGNYTGYKATAIGENDENIKEILRSEWKENFTTEQGIKFALSIFKKILGKNFSIKRFESAYVKKDSKKIERIHGDLLSKYLKS